MIFKEKRIILKNGKIAILKSPETSDAQRMLDYITTACGETDFLVRYPEEWDNMSVEKEEAWIKEAINSPNAVIINCVIDGEIVGNCEIRFRTGIKTAHRSTVAIAILKKYWNLGIGYGRAKKIVDKIKSELPTKLQAIRHEIYGNFQIIASTEVLKVFLETYVKTLKNWRDQEKYFLELGLKEEDE